MISFCPVHRINGRAITVHVVESEADLTGFRSFIRDNRARVAFDTETTGLDWWHREFKLRLAQFSNDHESWVIPVEAGEQFAADVAGALRYVKKLAIQNAPYDTLVVDKTLGVKCEELWPKVIDTKILAHLVDSRAEREGGSGHSLESLTRHYISDEIATEVKGSMTKLCHDLNHAEVSWRWSDVLDRWIPSYKPLGGGPKFTKANVFKRVPRDNPVYQLYSGMDPVLTFHLARKLGPLVPASARKLIPFEHKVAEICTYMSRRGIKLDVPYTEALRERLWADELEWAQLARELGVENVNSTEQCADGFEELGVPRSAFGATPSGKRKVDTGFLTTVQSQGTLAQVLLAKAIERAKGASKKRSSWVEKFLEQRDEFDYVHANINSIQARTARMSITGVPAQTLPAGEAEVRNCFTADDGHVVVSTDYANMELRFLAAHSQDCVMLRAFRNGEDLHQITADAAGVPRKAGKTTNFCVCFGGGWKAVHEQAGVSAALAKKAVDGFWATYKGVEALAERLTKQAKRQGYIETASGRRLYVDKTRPYSALNYFIQSGARDITCRALIRMHEAGLTPYMRLPIHDEVLFSVPTQHAERAAKMTSELMAETIKGLEIPTDPEIGAQSWGSLYELEDTKH